MINDLKNYLPSSCLTSINIFEITQQPPTEVCSGLRWFSFTVQSPSTGQRPVELTFCSKFIVTFNFKVMTYIFFNHLFVTTPDVTNKYLET